MPPLHADLFSAAIQSCQVSWGGSRTGLCWASPYCGVNDHGIFFFVMNTSGYSQSSSCQACLLASWPFSDLWNQIFSRCWVMWKTLANTLYSWKKLLLWHLSARISLNLLCYLTGWICLVQWTTGLLLQTRVQQPQPQGPGMLLMSNNAKKHGPATENNKSSLKNKSTGCN